ncbi:hypothetical protein BJ508DRAFT_414791 [Ascobolus immersus RN42]|uniref:Uncharacterized protein n=1 Tax=Ascobolus immersus RN42 TaxID=1160509 RepID=A0A3N4I9J9_ASCIM|nr:hypothetical protein BJ508DRAFT_414791 [Ascobolus immersus RN42]
MRCPTFILTFLLTFLFGALIQAQSLDLSQIRTMDTNPPEITAVTTAPTYQAVGENGAVETLGSDPKYKSAESSAGRVVGIAWGGIVGVVVGAVLVF